MNFREIKIVLICKIFLRTSTLQHQNPSTLLLLHTVFINDKPLRFISIYDEVELKHAKEHVIFSEHDKSMEEIIELLEKKNKISEIYYLSENPDAGWEVFLTHCSLVEAAGGLVQNKKGEFLVIFRLNKWDLPKGKIEYDESPEQAALREVEEECSVTGLSIVKKLPLTFHTYILKNKRKLKKTHWFLMSTDSDKALVPQKEEDIQEARWINENEIRSKVFVNTYSSIGELLNNFFQ